MGRDIGTGNGTQECHGVRLRVEWVHFNKTGCLTTIYTVFVSEFSCEHTKTNTGTGGGYSNFPVRVQSDYHGPPSTVVYNSSGDSISVG